MKKKIDTGKNTIAALIGGVLTVLFNLTITPPNIFDLLGGFATGLATVFFATLFADLILKRKD